MTHRQGLKLSHDRQKPLHVRLLRITQSCEEESCVTMAEDEDNDSGAPEGPDLKSYYSYEDMDVEAQPDPSVEPSDKNSEGHDGESIRQSDRSITRRRRGVTEADHAPFDVSFRPGHILFYSPPRQRQKWGETQVLPRTNFGDLFFDLFYVAATYNVSLILVDEPSGTGLLYAAGTFIPVMGIWVDKTNYDGRFVHEDDLYHRLSQLAQLVILATAVLYTRPVSVMSNISGNISMFLFALAVLLAQVQSILRYVEVYLKGIGQPAMKISCRFSLACHAVALAFYTAATTIAGVSFYGPSGAGRRLAGEEPTAAGGSTSDIPIILMFAGMVAYILVISVNVLFFFPTGGNHKKV